jgi:hypothetical protein
MDGSAERIVMNIDKVYKDDRAIETIDLVHQLIKQVGLGRVLDVIEPIYAIYNADKFFLVDESKIEKYVKVFYKLLTYHESIADLLLEDVKVLDQSSKNGKIVIKQLRKAGDHVPKLLVKTPLTATSDPISYEYYVGLTMNRLRSYGIQNFSLVYGRYTEKREDTSKKQSHVLYEYIRDKKGETMSLGKFLENMLLNFDTDKEISLLGIVFMVLISLQKAQDILQFTHYDLHYNNVLVLQLDDVYQIKYEYKGKAYFFYSKFVPFIIDYGRSHINPDVAVTYDKKFRDMERDVSFKTFKEYTTHLFGTPETQNSEAIVYAKKIDDTLVKHIKNVLGHTTIGNVLMKKFKTDDVDALGNSILNHYYGAKNKYVFPIQPNKFNKIHDMNRFVKGICTTISKYALQYESGTFSHVWTYLNNVLDHNFPFYLPNSFDVCSDYDPVLGSVGKPIDLVKMFYPDYKKSAESNMEFTIIDKITFDQIGSGRIKKKMKKTSKGTRNTRNAQSVMKIVNKIQSPKRAFQKMHKDLDKALDKTFASYKEPVAKVDIENFDVEASLEDIQPSQARDILEIDDKQDTSKPTSE